MPSNLSRRRVPRLHDRIHTGSARNLTQLRKTLKRALADLGTRAEDPNASVLDIQLVVQVVRMAAYPSFKGGREIAWSGTPYSTATWPEKLRDSEYAALLLPIPAGRVG